MRQKRRIAVYGGSFDPVHNGHLAIAQQLIELFNLDQFLLVPAHVAPHKRGADVTPALHRYAMLALATQHDRRLRISTLELEAPERPYTVETLTRLAQQPDADNAHVMFVMGADSWAEITTWRNWEQLLTMVDHLVVTRPGNPLHLDHVGAGVGGRVVDLRGAGVAQIQQALQKGQKGEEGAARAPRIYFTDAVMMGVSSTAARRAAHLGRRDELRALVTGEVAEYIEKYQLYQAGREILIADVEKVRTH